MSNRKIEMIKSASYLKKGVLLFICDKRTLISNLLCYENKYQYDTNLYTFLESYEKQIPLHLPKRRNEQLSLD